MFTDLYMHSKMQFTHFCFAFNCSQSRAVNFDLAVHPGMQWKGRVFFLFCFFEQACEWESDRERAPGLVSPLHASMCNAHAVLSGMCPRCLFTDFFTVLVSQLQPNLLHHTQREKNMWLDHYRVPMLDSVWARTGKNQHTTIKINKLIIITIKKKNTVT